MHNPFAPFIAIAQRRIPFTASDGQRPRLPPAPFTLSSVAWNPRPTTTAPTSASPFDIAPDAVVAAGCQRSPSPTLADTRIQLKLRRLHKGARIIAPPAPPCDASYKKSPQDASQNLGPHPQPIETEELKT
jgi:hypothetical protein